MLAHAFTTENAKEMALRSVESRQRRIADEQALLSSLPANANERTRYERTLKHMDKLDRMIDRTGDPYELAKLITARDTLYHQLFPRRGSLKPRAEKRNIAPTIDAGSGEVMQPSVDISTSNGTE